MVRDRASELDILCVIKYPGSILDRATLPQCFVQCQRIQVDCIVEERAVE